VDLLATVGTRHGATPAQVALAWLLSRKPWVAPIPGTTKLARMEENLGAANLVLTPVDLAEIEKVSEEIRIIGERYPESLEQMTER
jgi:aryl-alcohol dehydrogenase-like predicted oxidoreductase